MKLHAANYVQKCLVSPYMHLLSVGRILVKCGCLHGCANTRHGPRRTTSSMLSVQEDSIKGYLQGARGRPTGTNVGGIPLY